MGLFGKKENTESEVTLPDLPEMDDDLPSLDDSRFIEDLPDLELNELPPLPNNQNIGINQSAIKSEISRQRIIPQRNISGEYKPRFHLVESSNKKAPVRIGQLNQNIESSNPPEIKSFSKEVEPIYVRLDKFQTTVSSFEEIKEKVMDIEKLLTKIKETREKEDRELEGWENEIQVIKSRIEFIDKNIFNKLD